MKNEYATLLQPEAQASYLTGSRCIPISIRGVVQNELNGMKMDEVTCNINKPTYWSAGMFVATKPNAACRICVDITRLNQVVDKKRHTLNSVEQILGRLGGEANLFSKLDATARFCQVKL